MLRTKDYNVEDESWRIDSSLIKFVEDFYIKLLTNGKLWNTIQTEVHK